MQPLVGRPGAASVKKLIAISDDGSKLWQTSEPPMEMKINGAVDPPLIEGVCGELQFRLQPEAERSRCSVGAGDMNRGVRSEVQGHRFFELA
jgi:hypothetical protein